MTASHCHCLHRETPSHPEENQTDTDHANVRFPPPLIHLIAVLAAVGLQRLTPLNLPVSWLLTGFGAGVMLLSLLLAGSAFSQFARSNNPVPPNQPVNGLMTQGPFRFTRNPLYLALALLQLGMGLMTGNGWILATLPPALLTVRYYVIRREEAYLTRRFGLAYQDYQSRVRRWF